MKKQILAILATSLLTLQAFAETGGGTIGSHSLKQDSVTNNDFSQVILTCKEKSKIKFFLYVDFRILSGINSITENVYTADGANFDQLLRKYEVRQVQDSAMIKIDQRVQQKDPVTDSTPAAIIEMKTSDLLKSKKFNAEYSTTTMDYTVGAAKPVLISKPTTINCTKQVINLGSTGDGF